jgi:hypothetical protein
MLLEYFPCYSYEITKEKVAKNTSRVQQGRKKDAWLNGVELRGQVEEQVKKAEVWSRAEEPEGA